MRWPPPCQARLEPIRTPAKAGAKGLPRNDWTPAFAGEQPG
jgi:hypothetical protein